MLLLVASDNAALGPKASPHQSPTRYLFFSKATKCTACTGANVASVSAYLFICFFSSLLRNTPTSQLIRFEDRVRLPLVAVK